ncbi:MAG: hypothetical protein ACE10D_12550 [Planctomycetota bacterium]|nr:hypothetical protein [Planctomycetota bacterium]
MRAFLRSRLTWLLLIALLVPTLVRMAQRALMQDRRFLAMPVELNLTPMDAVEGRIVGRLVARLKVLGPVHLCDPELDHKVAGALLADPVVYDVLNVGRRWPRGYTADVLLRRPYATVRVGEHFVPVCLDGMVLPPEPYRERMATLFAIEGVRSQPPLPGEYWDDVRLDAGLLTLFQLAPHLAELNGLGLRGLDVSGAEEARKGVVLRGARDVSVLWGRPGATVAENSVERKVRYLRAFARYADLLAGQVLDVRLGEPYLRQSGAS